MKTVILAGGKGVRMRPLTYTIPKPLLPVGEKPIIEEIIERLREQGFSDLIIAVGYRAELIETFARDGAQFGVSIEYVRETQPLGTAGPLALVRDGCALPANEPLLVMNGDILTDIDMRALVDAHGASANELTVATREFQLRHPYGVIQLEGDRITGIVEKPRVTDVVSAGIYVLSLAALDLVPKGQFYDMPDLVNAVIAQGRGVGAYPFDDAWVAIDSIDQLDDAARMLAERHA
jgi:NDP-sugar pyrophosphorylase family protein